MTGRYKIYVSFELIQELFTQGSEMSTFVKCVSGVPSGSVFVGAETNIGAQLVIFYFVNPLIAEGLDIEFKPEYRKETK